MTEDEFKTVKTARHSRRGDMYDVLYRNVTVKSKLPIDDGDTIVVYMDSDGKIFARHVNEFTYKYEAVRPMSSPIFDSTFATGRFMYEEPMTTDQSQATPAGALAQSDAGPASSAGLIEAAEWHEEQAQLYEEANSDPRLVQWHMNCSRVLRYRAADRSVHVAELIPDCPTDGVAARQGNGG
jgi:hypothetical protein